MVGPPCYQRASLGAQAWTADVVPHRSPEMDKRSGMDHDFHPQMWMGSSQKHQKPTTFEQNLRHVATFSDYKTHRFSSMVGLLGRLDPFPNGPQTGGNQARKTPPGLARDLGRKALRPGDFWRRFF